LFVLNLNPVAEGVRMPNALFVNIAQSMENLNAVQRLPQSAAMKRAATVAWKISRASANEVEYLFGVSRGKVLCGYRVSESSDAWPTEEETGRLIVPVSETLERRLFDGLRRKMHGACAYGDVRIDLNGSLISDP
jgi:hypothetical protein